MSRQLLAQTSSYRLTRTFSIGSALVICLAGFVLTSLSRSMAVDRLELMAQQNNVALTQAFANGVWLRFAPFIGAAHTLSAEQIAAHPETRDLNATLKNLMAGTRVLKVKLYDLGGLTVYSTDPKQIGGDYSRKPGFVEAMKGNTLSELEFRDTFNAFGTIMQDRWVLSSYVPIRSGGDAKAIEGVAEIYSDVTDFYQHLHVVERVLIGVVAVAFGTVFLLLLGMVGWADRKMQNEHRRAVELSAATARAEAASRAKSEFLSHMSHELRTPLNGIIGFAELIRDEMMGPVGVGAYKKYAAHIHTSGVQLSNIISGVLELVRMESDDMAVETKLFDAVTVVREAVETMQSEANTARVALSFETAHERLDIDSDEAKIRQIVLNLVANGVKFTRPGGAVTVSLNQKSHDDPIRIVIADTGIGMRKEDIPLALAPFAQVDSSLAREFGGAGLGLPLANEMARLLGGAIEIASAPGKGTTITVTLPRRAASVAHKEPAIAA